MSSITRVLFGSIGVVGVLGLALFLFQKQFAQYNFSIQQEREAFEGFPDVGGEFEGGAPSQGELDQFLRELQKLQLEEASTSSELATSTTDR